MTNKEAIKYLIAPIATSTEPSGEYLKQKEAYELAVKALEERPQGEWVDEGQYAEGHSEHAYLCKICGYQIIENRFCKYCGATMKGGAE